MRAATRRPHLPHISPISPHISPTSRSHAARRVEAEENLRRYPAVRASGRRHLRASVPALLRTSSPDYEPWSPLPTTPLPPKSSPRRASSFGVAVA